MQKFNKNQFIFIGKILEQKKFPCPYVVRTGKISHIGTPIQLHDQNLCSNKHGSCGILGLSYAICW